MATEALCMMPIQYVINKHYVCIMYTVRAFSHPIGQIHRTCHVTLGRKTLTEYPRCNITVLQLFYTAHPSVVLDVHNEPDTENLLATSTLFDSSFV